MKQTLTPPAAPRQGRKHLAALALAAGVGLAAWGGRADGLFGPSALAAEAPASIAATTTATPATAEIAAAEMADYAMRFWASLTPEQQARAGFDFKDEQRFDWHFIPRERKGLPWKDMTPPQKDLGHAFLSSGLSQRGYAAAVSIMSLDQVLKELEAGKKGPVRDPDNYYFSIFGKPGPSETWGWRVEGHHLALNFTIAGGKAVAGGPIFFGTNPAEVLEGPRKGLRVLSVEEDMGRTLVKSLTEAQRKTAIIMAEAPKEVITGNSRKAAPGDPKGVPFGEMSSGSKQTLQTLVKWYANRLRPELAEIDLKQIEQAGWEKVYFSWAGGIEPGVGHYYRLHGPTFLVEFDDTQNNANHIHTVWRDAANDFGEDILRHHYDQTH